MRNFCFSRKGTHKNAVNPGAAACTRRETRLLLSLENPQRAIRNSKGVALVIILAFIVLLTVLVMAYFSYAALQRQISQASANHVAVEIFAQGAVNTIVSDLKQEIVTGSTNLSTNTAVYQVYYPLSPTNAIPALVGSSGSNGLQNLVKRSVSGVAFSPGGTSRAAAVSSTNSSQNRRSISPARWNAALLLPKADTTSTTDLTPTNSFTAPDWVLVARDGSNPTTWNDNLRWNSTNATTVVGRYAYAIYDEGGLLDVNVAGYPPGSSTNFTAGKGSLAYADLTVLPGMTTNAVSALVGWRNTASSQPGGSFPSYSFDNTSQTNYFNSVRTNTSGFLRTANTNLANGQSDRRFISRQQLIQFLTQGVPANPTEKAELQNALQFLGTFSRDVEQPSFRPDPNRPKNTTHQWAGGNIGYGGNDAYDSTGGKQNAINPSLLSVRNPSGGAVIKRRFPLSRLAMVKPNPSAADAVKIKDYFGLKWDGLNNLWTYDHGDPNQILKLSEIPNGREPDFFETMKAVINCDSLGKQYGGTEANAPVSPHHFDDPAGAAIDGIVNYQLIRIGANIIDQYDADSYPSVIAFGSPTRAFYGVENVPYLAGWMQSWYHMKQLTAADINSAKQPPGAGVKGYPFETWMMFQPILWNPHAPDPNLDTTQVPTNFRVTAGDMTGVGITIYPLTRPSWWQTGYVQNYPAVSGMTPNSWAAATLAPTVSMLTFNATPNTSSNVPASFQEPYRLLYHYPTGSNADAGPGYSAGKISLDALGSVADPVLAASDATVDGKTVIGFFGGKGWAGPWAADSPVESGKCLAGGSTSTANIQFTLQYQNSSGAWQTYDVINQVYTSAQPGNVATIDNQDTGTNIRGFPMGFRADPRTDRWGLFTMKSFPLAANATGVTTPPASNGIHSAWIYNFPQGTTLSPSAGMNSEGIYRLIRNASGQPLVDWTTNPFVSDLTVNLNIGNTASYIPGRKFYYNDPDHVLRRASGATFSSTTTGNTNDGLPLHTANYNSRPVILNRPFRSVAEMGYTFSDTPWKELNFLLPESGDSALLDAFCLNELQNAPADAVVAGRVNLNTKQANVLQALIQGASKAEGGIVSSAEAAAAAQALVTWTRDTTSQAGGILTKGPLRNRSELVGKFVSAVTYTSPPSSNLPNIGYDGNLSYSGFSSMLTSGTSGVFANTTAGKADSAIKRRRESIIRALADSGNTRTWNLLIDLVSQVGRYPAQATTLGNFVVEGEVRQWVHLAIDRYTGEVVTTQVEPVSE